jgi:DHA2 family lincomycin resistance protein-like MFS transporter
VRLFNKGSRFSCSGKEAGYFYKKEEYSPLIVLYNYFPYFSVAFIIALHIGLTVGIALIWTPAQTNGLNQLPLELYPHGKAVMNTLQQVGGAIGTAVAISILTGGMENYLHGSSAPTKQIEIANAMASGSHNVFLFAMVIALINLIMGFFIRRVVVNNSVMNSPH